MRWLRRALVLLLAAGVAASAAYAFLGPPDVLGRQAEPTLEVIHPPYLQLGDAPLAPFPGSESDRVQLLWQTVPIPDARHRTDRDDEFVVEYRALGAARWQRAGAPSQIATGVQGRVNHWLDVGGLDYAAEYDYRVRHLAAGKQVRTYRGTFRTRLAPRDATAFSFVAYGDSAYDADLQDDPLSLDGILGDVLGLDLGQLGERALDAVTRRLDGELELASIDSFRSVQACIADEDPAFVLLLGDNAYDEGSHLQYDARFDPDRNPEAVRWAREHIDYLVIGNHDVETANGLPTEQNYAVPIPLEGLTAPAAPPSGERAEHNYAFDYGLLHVATFDSNSLDDPARLRALLDWLVADLEASTASWKIVAAHHPVAGGPRKSPDPDDDYYQQLVPRLHEAGVDLLLTGDSHVFAWSYPLLGFEHVDGGEAVATFVLDDDRDYAKGAGLVQLIAGVGGKSIFDGSFEDYPFVAAGFSATTAPRGEFGFAHITVSRSRLLVQYVGAESGRVLAEFAISRP